MKALIAAALATLSLATTAAAQQQLVPVPVQARPVATAPAPGPATVRTILIKRADATDTVLPDLTTERACQNTIEGWYALGRGDDAPYRAIMCVDSITGQILRFATDF